MWNILAQTRRQTRCGSTCTTGRERSCRSRGPGPRPPWQWQGQRNVWQYRGQGSWWRGAGHKSQSVSWWLLTVDGWLQAVELRSVVRWAGRAATRRYQSNTIGYHYQCRRHSTSAPCGDLRPSGIYINIDITAWLSTVDKACVCSGIDNEALCK